MPTITATVAPSQGRELKHQNALAVAALARRPFTGA